MVLEAVAFGGSFKVCAVCRFVVMEEKANHLVE